jgi:hypothetical protein
MIPEDVARAVELACIVDVMAPKPGNVNRDHDFADTTCENFLVSAWAVAPVFARSHELSVGELILGARRATSRFVSANTNLGIILLLAPFAKAAVQRAPGSLRDRLRRVLDGLTVRDCSLAYAAIREAHPGGLGRIDEHDVSDEPTITLLQAMDVAKSRDSVASEYCEPRQARAGMRTSTFTPGSSAPSSNTQVISARPRPPRHASASRSPASALPGHRAPMSTRLACPGMDTACTPRYPREARILPTTARAFSFKHCSRFGKARSLPCPDHWHLPHIDCIARSPAAAESNPPGLCA